MTNNPVKVRPQAFARTARVLAVAALALLGACAQQPKNMYSWQSYQPSVYAYLKDDGADYAAQSLAMQRTSKPRGRPTCNCRRGSARIWACCT